MSDPSILPAPGLFCPPAATTTTLPDGVLLCTLPPAACKAPAIQVCSDSLRCTCVAQQDARLCTVSVVYPVGQPAAVRLASDPGCDAAGVELALAVMAAKLLGAPR